MASSLGDASSALNDLIKKSIEFSSGPPALRRLHTTRSNLDDSGKIRRWTFGQKHSNMQNKLILMVGETGTGKTTLINTMVNYSLGVKFEDKVWFEITEEEKKDQTESQTSEITVYEIFSEQKPESLTIIDTPGYGDTRGMHKDMEIPHNLYKLFLHDTGVKSLDAVCLVLKASQNRISDAQCYIFEAVLSLFGKDIGENIVLFLTYSNGATPKDALKAVEKEKIPCCHDAEDQPVHFLFNNCQSEEQSTTKKIRAVKMGWEMGEESLEEFFEFLKLRDRKSLTMTVDVLQERIQLEACVQSLKERIEFIEAKQRELTGVQNALKQNQKQIEKDGNHCFIITTFYKEKVGIAKDALRQNKKATCCEECEENCHEFGCSIAINARLCYVMKRGHCTVCKCHYTKHVKEAKRYVEKEKQETVTFQELKNKYSNKNDLKLTYNENALKTKTEHKEHLKRKEEMMILESRLKELLAEKEKERNCSVKEAYETIIKLSEIALKPDSAFTLRHLDFLIPRVEEAGEAWWAQKLKNLQKAAASESTTSTVEYLNRVKGFFSEKFQGLASKQ